MLSGCEIKACYMSHSSVSADRNKPLCPPFRLLSPAVAAWLVVGREVGVVGRKTVLGALPACGRRRADIKGQRECLCPSRTCKPSSYSWDPRVWG